MAGVVLAGGAVWISDGDTAAAPFSQTNGVADVDQARDQLASLEVRPEHSTDGYDRDDWPHWMPVGDGCDAREWVLREHAEDMVRTKGACTIGNGRWTSSYDGEVVTDPSELDIDHLVPLAEAHASGGYAWSEDRRGEFANDVRFLVPVTASSNRSKGDADPAEWLPDVDVCTYLVDYVAAKAEYALTVDRVEHDAIDRGLDRC
ncbi:hypothetical protein ACZ91_40055 [Streptomyces regensis]|nr:hypothetical protein ACZ91_40055 [Streptomyces regensis]